VPFRHRNIRLRPANYVGQRSYFITISCAGRRPVFANPSNADWLIDVLRKQAATHRFGVTAYCVMPDHLHALVSGLNARSDLLAFVKNLKQSTAREYLQRWHRPLWEKKFYDHILRPNDNASGIAGYIWFNPVRKGLCNHPREYPYSGSFVLDWKRTMLPLEIWAPDWKAKPPA
jgi:REP-associated tyrosine transposase